MDAIRSANSCRVGAVERGTGSGFGLGPIEVAGLPRAGCLVPSTTFRCTIPCLAALPTRCFAQGAFGLRRVPPRSPPTDIIRLGC